MAISFVPPSAWPPNGTIAIGTASPHGKTQTMEIKGRDLVAGIPKTVMATSEEIHEALVEPINAIVEAVLLAGTGNLELEPESVAALAAVDTPMRIQVFSTPT